MLALTRAQFADICAQNGDRHDHAGASIADGRAGFAGRAILFAGDAHQSTDRLGNHIEGETFLEGAAGAEALHLAVDDRRVQPPYDIRTKAKPFDRAWGEVLDHYIGLL